MAITFTDLPTLPHLVPFSHLPAVDIKSPTYWPLVGVTGGGSHVLYCVVAKSRLMTTLAPRRSQIFTRPWEVKIQERQGWDETGYESNCVVLLSTRLHMPHMECIYEAQLVLVLPHSTAGEEPILVEFIWITQSGWHTFEHLGNQNAHSWFIWQPPKEMLKKAKEATRQYNFKRPKYMAQMPYLY